MIPASTIWGEGRLRTIYQRLGKVTAVRATLHDGPAMIALLWLARLFNDLTHRAHSRRRHFILKPPAKPWRAKRRK